MRDLVTARRGGRLALEQSSANIDVLLKQRHDELPKLIETCKQYMRFQQETLARVIRARTAAYAASSGGGMAALGTVEQQLRGDLGRLFAVAENYPQLEANESFREAPAPASTPLQTW